MRPTTNTGIRDKFWQRLAVEDAGHFPQPDFALVDGTRIESGSARWRARVQADLGEALLCVPGSYILKPRFGSNGFCVARIVSHADGTLTVESDCPDTGRYLEEFPRRAELHGRDLVAAVATHRGRFIDRATAGLPEQTLNQSILEEEIRQDRPDGSIFEPRIVVQRVQSDSGEQFATLGAICKRIVQRSARPWLATSAKNRWKRRCAASFATGCRDSILRHERRKPATKFWRRVIEFARC